MTKYEIDHRIDAEFVSNTAAGHGPAEGRKLVWGDGPVNSVAGSIFQ